MKQQNLKLSFLGGVSEVGKNMMCLEYGNEIIVIDSGCAFPSDEMMGVDLVIPDITYLINNRQKIKAIILEWISNASNKRTLNVENADKIPKILNKIALLLLIFFEIKPVIVPAKADIIAIKDKINAASLTLNLQKSSKNFFPITVCKT